MINGNLAAAYQGGYNVNSASDSEGSNHTHRYGAMSSSDDRLAIGSNDDLAPVHSKRNHEGISIKPNQTVRERSPQYGVPKVLGNYFAQNATQSSASSSRYDQSTRSENTTSKSESGFDFSAYDNKAANKPTGTTMKKSDSTASDWLSTPPTDDFFGIDVKGIEKDRTHFRRDPKI